MRTKIEQEPQERENIYYKLFNLIEQPVQICELVWDEKGEPIDIIILNVNSAFEKHSGLRREHILGRHIKEILPVVEQIWLERYAEVLRSGKETHFEEYNTSLEKWLEVSTSPMGGNRFVAVFKDITERKKKKRCVNQKKISVHYLIQLMKGIV
jgi:PAS domain S-box-containing protein